ncbi:hypothetical protein M405DRAFT_939239 [Rhizopogon salebrosus TDB-379]|nr:hypothetical protein M405DRAFT_939239 [Rhizopogon salebrosus TDB-379]
MLTYKQAWVRGQGASTRAKNGLDRVEGRMDASIDRYMAARNALVSLAPLLGETGWESDRQQLNKHDARVMGELRQGATLGTDRLSWIWTTRPVALNDDPGVQEGLRMEWCKARARAMRWSEEVELLEEEMQRVLRFLRWHATWWKEQAHRRACEKSADTEGLQAYALRQADLRESLRERFMLLWLPYLRAATS